MFSEIIKLIPQVDRNSLSTMFKTLNDRFAQVAKKFAQGLKGALKLAPLATVAGVFLSKLLNPLEKAEAIIDRIVNKGDDAVTNADEFESDAGRLLRLEALGAAKGLDAATLRQLLGKFQGALAVEKERAALQPEAAPGPLREFITETDTASAFYSFIQSLQRVEKSRQIVVQREVFGDRVRGKASEFFNATDFAEILSKLPSADALRTAAERSGTLSDQKDLNEAIRNSEDFVKKSQLLTEQMIKDIDVSERIKLQSEDQSLIRYDALKSSSIAIQELTHKFDQLASALITDVAPKLVNLLTELDKGLKIMMPFLIEAKDFMAEKLDKGLDLIVQASLAIEGYWQEFKKSRIYLYFKG